jgi:hypothetical protein
MKRILMLGFGLITAISVFTYGTLTVMAQDYITVQPDICSYNYDQNVNLNYDFEYLGSKKKLTHDPGAIEEVTIFFKNTGTIPMFSDKSGCNFRPLTRLGTDKWKDRESIFYNGWISPNRIELDQAVVKPGEKGSFTFDIQAPYENGVYREFFDIVVEGQKWLEKPFAVNFDVGEYMIEKREFLDYVNESKKVTNEDFNGAKSIEVDVSEQKMFLKIGDITIREFPVSSGKWATPTPYGHTQIYYKQEVRVSAAWPHYIMPKWMNFRHGGYGIHALPSISWDNGYFWSEALNHIGQARSHGCIRLLPQDAEFAYDFTEVGTPVWVHP